MSALSLLSVRFQFASSSIPKSKASQIWATNSTNDCIKFIRKKGKMSVYIVDFTL